MQKIRIVILLIVAISIFSCNNDDATPDDLISEEETAQDVTPCLNTLNSFFTGNINGRDTCIIVNNVNIGNGYGFSGSGLGRIYRSVLSQSNFIPGNGVFMKSMSLWHGTYNGSSFEDFTDFFQEGRFGFTEEGYDGFSFSLSEEDDENFSFYSTRETEPSEDNFIEITSVESFDGFIPVVEVEARMNAILYDESGNEAFRITDGQLRLDFRQ